MSFTTSDISEHVTGCEVNTTGGRSSLEERSQGCSASSCFDSSDKFSLVTCREKVTFRQNLNWDDSCWVCDWTKSWCHLSFSSMRTPPISATWKHDSSSSSVTLTRYWHVRSPQNKTWTFRFFYYSEFLTCKCCCCSGFMCLWLNLSPLGGSRSADHKQMKTLVFLPFSKMKLKYLRCKLRFFCLVHVPSADMEEEGSWAILQSATRGGYWWFIFSSLLFLYSQCNDVSLQLFSLRTSSVPSPTTCRGRGLTMDQPMSCEEWYERMAQSAAAAAPAALDCGKNKQTVKCTWWIKVRERQQGNVI